nr:FtsX-like permease family protein [Heyndrickxia coagulans]
MKKWIIVVILIIVVIGGGSLFYVKSRAKRKDILVQVLIEAVVLSALGGLLGVGVGFAAIKIYALFASTGATQTLPVTALSFGFSLIVGVVFGVFPANKASKLNPIQALRYE